MATVGPTRYARYEDLLDSLYRARDWWRTVHILERVLLYVALLFAAVAGVTLLEAHLHLSAALRWPLCIALVGYFVVGMAWLVFRPLFRQWTEEEVAVHIERRFPELDNQLINALQLGVDEKVVSPAMVQAIVAQAAGSVDGLAVRESVSTRRARYLTLAALVATVALGAWAALSFRRFSNALQRVILPGRDIAAVGAVEIVTVRPGDTRLNSGSDLEVVVETRGGPSGDVEAHLLYQYADGKERLRKAMSPVSRRLYLCRVEEVKAPLSYRVNVGGTESRRFEVAVVEPPVIVQRAIRYVFPSYTREAGWKSPRLDPDTNGDIRAPRGTVVTLRMKASKPIRSGKVQLSSGETIPVKIHRANPHHLEATLTVLREGLYTVRIADSEGLENRDPRESKIIALLDRPPTIAIRSPGKDVTLGVGEHLRLALVGRDDYGIADVGLYARVGKDGPQRVVHTWKEFASRRQTSLAFDWDLADKAYGYKAGDEIFYYAVARDNHADVTGTTKTPGGELIPREAPRPQEAKSAEFKIRIIDRAEVAKARREAISNWETELRKVLEDQIAARRRVSGLEGERQSARLQKEGGELAKTQRDIFTRTVTIANGIESAEKHLQAVKESLTLLAYGEMTLAAKRAASILRLAQLRDLKTAYGELAASQDRIIAALRRLLNILPDLAQHDDRAPTEEDDFEDMDDEEEEQLRDLLKNLKEMIRQKKKVKETTSELAKLPMEDYTPEDEKKLENCKAIEERWDNFLKATISDLSKLQEQDFANTTLLDELIEVHSEVEMAKDALSKKATEIATALEDNGLMLAEKLTKQLEKWLPDTPDRDRWQMEDPLTDGYETPMAELPKELEDLVGDLMEEEEDLQQDVEDATSAWADSMDAAGWDAMDGPISNFSASGVTGNRLPNTSELNGRSGEGRQGQSVGEMVGNEFVGKGGRRTPTRLTSEAFQKSQIKDSSSTPPGGATGGGKVGGASGEGLEGPAPPDILVKMKDFARKQAEIRNTAEKLALKFEILNYPPVFDPVISGMQELEATLNSGRYMEARRKFGVLLKDLGGTRMFLRGDLALDRVRSPSLPAHLQDEIIDTAGAAVPEEFRAYLKQYYSAISTSK